jgi:hypothetical protein
MPDRLSDLIDFEDDDSYKFPITRGHASEPDKLQETVSDLLYRCLLEIDYVAGLLKEHGEAAVERYLGSRGFIGELPKRVGDFGEVLAGSVICELEEQTLPIYKLRYRERADWSMRLTDVFSIQSDAERITAFCFTSVKSGVTRPTVNVALEGYKQLLDDFEHEHPQILGFISEQLFRQNRFDELTLFDSAMSARYEIQKLYRLFLVFDAIIWNNRLIDTLAETEDIIKDFKCYVLLVDAMRNLVEDCYRAATDRCFV